MFDVLVESTKSKQGRRASRYFAVTTAIYAIALVAIGVGTIIGFSPALAEEFSLSAMLAPPVPSAPSPPPVVTPTTNRSAEPVNTFTPPKQPPKVMLPDDAARIEVRQRVSVIGDSGLPPCNSCTGKTGIPGVGQNNADPVPPPPEIKREPKLDPTPTPEIKQGPNKVSEGVLLGGAINKVTPAYPQIARATRASGPVQVVVTISEEGRVIEAYAASGHPLLRSTAVEAARRWTFKPTRLSNIPVKVQGVLTFNFTLQ